MCIEVYEYFSPLDTFQFSAYKNLVKVGGLTMLSTHPHAQNDQCSRECGPSDVDITNQ